MKRIWSTPVLLVIILLFVCGTGCLLVSGAVKPLPLFIYAIIQVGLICRIAKLIADLEYKNKDKMDIMRNCSSKQDDAIRRKQARIDELEREARQINRRRQ